MKNEFLLYFNKENDFLNTLNYLKNSNIIIKDFLSPYFVSNIELNAKSSVPKYTLIGAIIGLAVSLLLILWLGTFDYPLNIGGKPFFFFPTTIPMIFSVTIISASFFGFIGFIVNSELPQWHIKNDLIAKAEMNLKNNFCILIETDESDISSLIETLKTNYYLSGYYQNNINLNENI